MELFVQLALMLIPSAIAVARNSSKLAQVALIDIPLTIIVVFGLTDKLLKKIGLLPDVDSIGGMLAFAESTMGKNYQYIGYAYVLIWIYVFVIAVASAPEDDESAIDDK